MLWYGLVENGRFVNCNILSIFSNIIIFCVLTGLSRDHAPVYKPPSIIFHPSMSTPSHCTFVKFSQYANLALCHYRKTYLKKFQWVLQETIYLVPPVILWHPSVPPQSCPIRLSRSARFKILMDMEAGGSPKKNCVHIQSLISPEN